MSAKAFMRRIFKTTINVYKGTAAAAALIGFVFAGALICVSVAENTNSPCAGEHQSASLLCKGNMLFHETVIENALPAVLNLVFILLALSAVVGFSRHVPVLYAQLIRVESALCRSRYGDREQPKNPLTELFSQGILNSQVYG